MANGTEYEFVAPLWEWESKTSWFFVSVPEADADEIEERFGRRAAGFGSVRVDVNVGATSWSTSLFPSTQESTYVLPVKKAVRVAEGLTPGSPVAVRLSISGG